MKLTPETIRFIQANLSTDTHKLLLSKERYPSMDIPFVIEQILARRQIKEKLPTWFACEQILLPSRIAAEQCSSEQTAAYKQSLVKGDVVCDLTGGLGVDSFFLSKKSKKSYYIERFDTYCEAALHNFQKLGATHIEVMQGDSRELLPTLPAIDTFYVDPARRSDLNKRLFALEDCEPNILQLKGELLKRAKRLIIKISPMADLKLTLDLLPETTEVHILSVKNECKELLFVLDATQKEVTPPTLVCINFGNHGREQQFRFNLSEENSAQPAYAAQVGNYLYEPNSAILKAGAFKIVAKRFGLEKLHVNSHLYTSATLLPEFPGRVFHVTELIEFSSKQIKKLAAKLPKANITIRNFPLSVEELRKRTGIKEGGNIYLFGTTIGHDQKQLIQCTKA